MKIRTIDLVTQYFGNAYRASKAIGVVPQQYAMWQAKGFIPFKRGRQIEELTKGEVKAMQIYEDAANHIDADKNQ